MKKGLLDKVSDAEMVALIVTNKWRAPFRYENAEKETRTNRFGDADGISKKDYDFARESLNSTGEYLKINAITAKGIELVNNFMPEAMADKKLRSFAGSFSKSKVVVNWDKAESLDSHVAIRALGVATIDEIGSENVYILKDNKPYYFKPGNTDNYSVGEHDFSNDTAYEPTIIKGQDQDVSDTLFQAQITETLAELGKSEWFKPGGSHTMLSKLVGDDSLESGVSFHLTWRLDREMAGTSNKVIGVEYSVLPQIGHLVSAKHGEFINIYDNLSKTPKQLATEINMSAALSNAHDPAIDEISAMAMFAKYENALSEVQVGSYCRQKGRALTEAKKVFESVKPDLQPYGQWMLDKAKHVLSDVLAATTIPDGYETRLPWPRANFIAGTITNLSSVSLFINKANTHEGDKNQFSVEVRVFTDKPQVLVFFTEGSKQAFEGKSVKVFNGSGGYFAETYKDLTNEIIKILPGKINETVSKIESNNRQQNSTNQIVNSTLANTLSAVQVNELGRVAQVDLFERDGEVDHDL